MTSQLAIERIRHNVPLAAQQCVKLVKIPDVTLYEKNGQVIFTDVMQEHSAYLQCKFGENVQYWPVVVPLGDDENSIVKAISQAIREFVEYLFPTKTRWPEGAEL